MAHPSIRQKWKFFSIFVLLVFCSCYQESPSSKTLRLALAEDPSSLDPRKGADAVSSQMHFMLFEGLTRLCEDGTIELAQASDLHISEDQMTYTFQIGNEFWSDGTPVTSYDFLLSWQTILSPEFAAPNAYLFYPIQNAEQVKKGDLPITDLRVLAPDPKTLIIKLQGPTPYFLKLLSFSAFSPIPSHLHTFPLSKWAFNGPFVLDSWKLQTNLVLKKNSYYKKEIFLDAISIAIVESERTALYLYEKGLIDLIGPPFSSIPLDAKNHLKDPLILCPCAATTLLTFNTKQLPFSSANLRKAFSFAIDRHKLTHYVNEYGDIPAFSLIPPSLKENCDNQSLLDWNSNLAKHYLELALEELQISKSELESMICYLYDNTPAHRNLAQILQQEWYHSLGIQISLNSLDRKTLLETLSKRNYTLSHTTFRAQFPDPISILEKFKEQSNIKNYCHWEHPTFIDQINHSFVTTGDSRLHLLIQAEQIFMDELPMAPLYHTTLPYLIKPHVKNIHFSTVGGIFFERLALDVDPL